MWHISLAIALVLVQCSAAAPLTPSEWRYFSPILSTQIRVLGKEELDGVLARFCETSVHPVQRVGPTCTTRQLGPDFSDIVDRKFHPKAAVYGHFLGPESDDVAVSAWSAETHPYRWGGTLLLTKRGSVWVPIWYRSGLIIDSCEKVVLPDRREVLFCEDEDSGMGHALHYLYTVDFQHPSDLEHSLLAKADAFRDDCVSQKQVLKALRWAPDRQEVSVEIDTTEWNRRSNGTYCSNYPKQHPSTVRLTFVVTTRGLRKTQTQPPR